MGETLDYITASYEAGICDINGESFLADPEDDDDSVPVCEECNGDFSENHADFAIGLEGETLWFCSFICLKRYARRAKIRDRGGKGI